MHAPSLNIDIHLFVSTFALIFLAELPDKTAFAVLIMATRKHPMAIFVGVALAFLVQTVVAICFGKAFSLLPEHWVHMASGALFLLFAVLTWIRPEESEHDEEGQPKPAESFLRTAISAFTVIFIAEWGDLTQLATATLVAKFPSAILTLFLAAVLALWSATAAAIFVGNHAKRWLNPAILQKVAAIAFALVGAAILTKG